MDDLWKARFRGQPISPAGTQADGSGNGEVDSADYIVWRKNQGASLFYGGSGSAAAFVPEPASLASVLIFSLLAGLAPPRRLRR